MRKISIKKHVNYLLLYLAMRHRRHCSVCGKRRMCKIDLWPSDRRKVFEHLCRTCEALVRL